MYFADGKLDGRICVVAFEADHMRGYIFAADSMGLSSFV